MSPPSDTEALWTSTQVAKAFGVGVSSIKRWTDEGVLETVKTIGGHRRYRLDTLHAFARGRGLPLEGLPPLEVVINPGSTSRDELVENLLHDLDEGKVEVACRTIIGYLGQSADPVGFMDQVLGQALVRIGELWAAGEWTVEKEHRSAYCIAEAIDRSRRPDPPRGSLAVLACPPGEEHCLPLNMLRFVMASNGWRSDFIGANVPWESLRAAVVRLKPDLVLLTSRSEVPFNSPDFAKVSTACRRAGATVCIGGSWARGGGRKDRAEKRFRTLAGFERWLHSGKESGEADD